MGTHLKPAAASSLAIILSKFLVITEQPRLHITLEQFTTGLPYTAFSKQLYVLLRLNTPSAQSPVRS